MITEIINDEENKKQKNTKFDEALDNVIEENKKYTIEEIEEMTFNNIRKRKRFVCAKFPNNFTVKVKVKQSKSVSPFFSVSKKNVTFFKVHFLFFMFCFWFKSNFRTGRFSTAHVIERGHRTPFSKLP